jgi:hypothetical protein
VAVIVMLLLPRRMAGASGMIYMLMGPAHGFQGMRYGKARAKLIAAREAARAKS